MGDTVITIIGNLTADPELRFTPSGAAVANFTVASTPRMFDRQSNEWKDGETLFMRCSVWRDAAENVAESLQRGMRVIVSGRLKSRSYETKEGEKRTVVELDVDEIGPSLRSATAKVKQDPAWTAEASAAQQGGGWSGGGQQQGGDRGQPVPVAVRAVWSGQQGGQQGGWGQPAGAPQGGPQGGQQAGWGQGARATTSRRSDPRGSTSRFEVFRGSSRRGDHLERTRPSQHSSPSQLSGIRHMK